MKTNNIESVKLSGNVVNREDILIKVLLNDPTNNQARTELCYSQIMRIKDLHAQVSHPTYYFNKYLVQHDKSKLTPKLDQYKLYQLLLILLDIDPVNPLALETLTGFMTKFGYKAIQGFEEEHTIQAVAMKNFMVNKDNEPQCYFYLCVSYYPRMLVQVNQQVVVNIRDELIKGIAKFPKHTQFYQILARYLINNYDTIQIPNVGTFNRVQLLQKAIENISLDEEKPILPLYYGDLSKYLLNNQQVEINGKSYDKISLLVGAINKGPNLLLLKRMVELMSANQKVKILNNEYSRVDILNKWFLTNHGNNGIYLMVFNLLSKIYESENNIDMYKVYNKLYSDQLEKEKNNYINALSKSPNSLLYIGLESTLEDGEKVLLNGELIGKKECLIRSISNNPLGHPGTLYKLSTLLDGDEQIKFENGDIYNRKKLIKTEADTCIDAIDSLYSYYAEYDYGVEDDRNSSTYNTPLKRDFYRLHYAVMFSERYPDFAKVYFSCGSYLSKYSLDNLNQVQSLVSQYKSSPPEYFGYSKRQLFKKYLELSEPIYPSLKQSNFDGWYNLAKEMAFNDQDIEFHKSKRQILIELLKVKPNHAGIYHELSKSLQDNNSTIEINGQKYTKMQLLLKSFDLEKGHTLLKSNIIISMVGCSSNDSNDKIQFLDGSELNKLQLIIKLIEQYPPVVEFDTYIFKELLETMNHNNIEQITMGGKELSRKSLINFKNNLEKQSSEIDNLFK